MLASILLIGLAPVASSTAPPVPAVQAVGPVAVEQPQQTVRSTPQGRPAGDQQFRPGVTAGAKDTFKVGAGASSGTGTNSSADTAFAKFKALQPCDNAAAATQAAAAEIKNNPSKYINPDGTVNIKALEKLLQETTG